MPLQKSFSEQCGSPKARQHRWNRSRSHAASLNRPAPANPPAHPLEPVSEATKNKLNAFNFCPPAADSMGQTKPSATGSTSTTDHSATPVTRLAWQDLIGRPSPKDQVDDASPNERLLWDTRQNAAYNMSPMMSRKRGKKRARSSSPTSSPNTPAVNVKKLSQALKSPHPDPALQLWDRFSLSSSADVAPKSAANPALAQLMTSSSPRHPKVLGPMPQAANESSLRRAMSCGDHWPKRRRLDRADAAVPGHASLGESPSNTSKLSMVSALLDSVTGEINRSRADETRDQVLKSPSPKKKRSRPSPIPSKPSLPPVPRQDQRTRNHVVYDLSDYSDDGFDDDTLMELDAGLRVAQHENTEPSATSSSQQPVPTVQSSKGETQGGQNPPCPPCVEDEFDEFDEFDDDTFAAVAEDLVAEIDSEQDPLMRFTPSTKSQQHTEAKAPTPKSLELTDDSYDDDFGEDIDLEAVERVATQSAQQTGGSIPPPTGRKPKTIQRYLVTNILPSDYIDGCGRKAPEKILLVQPERSNSIMTVHLRDDWVDTPASLKAYVHIIGEFEVSGRCIIDNSQNILVLHPDQLISATVIADSFTCMRRAVLQDRVKATSEKTAPLVYGTLLHEIFQEALLSNEWSPDFLYATICKITEKHVEDLYAIKVTLSESREHLFSKMTELRHWATAFVTPYPRPDAVVQGRNGEKATMSVTKLLDVEEHVWSPMYGMKGNIDATVQVTMRDGPQRRILTVPFEVKTGKNATSNHQAQTSLYNLLLSDRYDIEIAYGILYYMETSQTIRIPTIRNELRHMIMQRNQLACYVRERSAQLPAMKRSTNSCGKCYAKSSCFIYHRLADNGDGETSGMKEKFDEVVKHLTPHHQEFFLKWDNLLTKEEKDSQKLRRELWTMTSQERERVGRCFSNVIIEEGSAQEESDSPKINRYRYALVKENPSADFSFVESQLAVGEPIVVSDEQGHFALALGFVTSVRKQKICVAVDRRLHNARIRQPGFDETSNQVFTGIMEVARERTQPTQRQGEAAGSPVRYRLDKDEFSNGMATVRNNLVQVMADDIFGSRQIRRLVVDMEPPTFKSATTQYSISNPESVNVDQRQAIEKVMSANDYALVLGMPGTGKTTTIAHIIRALIRQGKSVLLTSYTHSAVDNILLKLKHDETPILRLGAPAKVHSEVREFATLAGQQMDSLEQVQNAWHNTPIVATTCLGVNHQVFQERTFDYCIVDEASQITLPICLGPIRMARTFVLVGDHNQLPPLVQNEEAKQGGLDISLFKLLSDKHPDSVVNLEHQYRMCEDVMALSNTLIYEGRLKCGTESLRHRKLEVPHMSALQRKHFDPNSILGPNTPKSICAGWRQQSCWLRQLVDPEARVRFINTDALPMSREEAKGNRIVNPTEARIVTHVVDALLATGVPGNEIGVMTHYRSQLALLKHGLRGHGDDVELHTADRFQGRDKEVVVLSLVRSNEACSIGDLLKDWRRINVVFTRAKTKLLVVGSRDTLKGSGEQEMLSKFVKLLEARDWIYDLSADSLDGHCFEARETQTMSSALSGSQPSPTKVPKVISSARGHNTQRDKENQRPKMPKKGKISDRAILKGRPILGDIFHELME